VPSGRAIASNFYWGSKRLQEVCRDGIHAVRHSARNILHPYEPLRPLMITYWILMRLPCAERGNFNILGTCLASEYLKENPDVLPNNLKCTRVERGIYEG